MLTVVHSAAEPKPVGSDPATRSGDDCVTAEEAVKDENGNPQEEKTTHYDDSIPSSQQKGHQNYRTPAIKIETASEDGTTYDEHHDTPHELSISTAILDSACRCSSAFLRSSSALEHTRNTLGEASSSKKLRDELGRFKIWAGNLGVFSGGYSSADYRLRHDPNIKSVVLKLLGRLEDTLKSTAQLGAYLDKPKGPRDTDSDVDCSSDSSLGISDESSPSELEELAESSLSQDERTKKISETITHLYRITAIIKKPQSNKEDERVKAWLGREGQELDDQLQGLESYTGWSVARQFPRLQHSPILADRIIQTVLFRRKRFLYRESHRMKLQRGADDPLFPPSPISQVEIRPALHISSSADEQPVSEAKGKTKAVTFVNTEASTVNRNGFSSYAKSIVLSGISPSVREGLEHMDVPPPPRLEPGRIETICPYCSVPLGKETLGKDSMLRWK